MVRSKKEIRKVEAKIRKKREKKGGGECVNPLFMHSKALPLSLIAINHVNVISYCSK